MGFPQGYHGWFQWNDLGYNNERNNSALRTLSEASVNATLDPTSTIQYETDYYAWLRHQAELLRAKRFSELDLVNLIEELEDLGRSEKRSIVSHLGVLLGHLLKWQYQADYPHKKSWRATINEQRSRVQELLDDNPSLRPQLATFIAKGYKSGLNLAVSETPLDYDAFPETCPWTEEQILGDYLPD